MKTRFIVVRSDDDGSLVICFHKSKKERSDAAIKQLKDFFKYRRGSCYEVTLRCIKPGTDDYDFYEELAK